MGKILIVASFLGSMVTSFSSFAQATLEYLHAQPTNNSGEDQIVMDYVKTHWHQGIDNGSLHVHVTQAQVNDFLDPDKGPWTAAKRKYWDDWRIAMKARHDLPFAQKLKAEIDKGNLEALPRGMRVRFYEGPLPHMGRGGEQQDLHWSAVILLPRVTLNGQLINRYIDYPLSDLEGGDGNRRWLQWTMPAHAIPQSWTPDMIRRFLDGTNNFAPTLDSPAGR